MRLANNNFGRHGFDKTWVWQDMGLARHGFGKTWVWQDMGLARHGFGKTWVWQNMGLAKHGFDKTWVLEDIGLARHRFGKTWVLEDMGLVIWESTILGTPGGGGGVQAQSDVCSTSDCASRHCHPKRLFSRVHCTLYYDVLGILFSIIKKILLYKVRQCL